MAPPPTRFELEDRIRFLQNELNKLQEAKIEGEGSLQRALQSCKSWQDIAQTRTQENTKLRRIVERFVRLAREARWFFFEVGTMKRGSLDSGDITDLDEKKEWL